MEENTGSTGTPDAIVELLNEKKTQQQIRDADPTRIESVAEHLKKAAGTDGPVGPKGVRGMLPRAWRPGITPEAKKKRNAKRKAQKKARRNNR